MAKKKAASRSAPRKPLFIVREAHRDDIPQLEELVEHFVKANRLLPRTTEELYDLIPFGFVAVAGSQLVGLRPSKFIPQSSQKSAASPSMMIFRDSESDAVSSNDVWNWPKSQYPRSHGHHFRRWILPRLRIRLHAPR